MGGNAVYVILALLVLGVASFGLLYEDDGHGKAGYGEHAS